MSAVDLALRSTVVLLTGLAVAAALRSRSAALRHCVLAVAITGAVGVMPLQLVVPAWRVSIPTASPASPGPRVTAQAAIHRAPISTESVPRRTAAPSLAVAWIAGSLVMAAALIVSVLRFRRIAARAHRVSDGRWLAIGREAAAVSGVGREVPVLQTDTLDVLATWGLFRPRILVPAHACEWSDARIRAVLSHEFAHIRRHDWFVQMVAEIARSILWFNPLAWLACRRLRREGEQACDDVVLRLGMPPREYAGHLLDLARLCRRSGSPWTPAIGMAHSSSLERRIVAMLNPRIDRRAVSRRGLVTIAALLLALALPVAALRSAQAPPSSLSGSLYDPTGAVLPGVELTLHGPNDAKWTASSDAAGRFEFPGIQPGRYLLSAALPGFRSLRQEFDLQNARDWDRAITMQVGDLSETISVRAPRVPPPAAPSQAAAPAPIRVGGNIRVPLKELDVKPVYPAAMRSAGREGVVPIQAIIGRDGTVTSVRVLTAQVHPDFAIAAVDAVRQWRFTPTLLNGEPVEVVMTVSVTFSLSD